MKKLLFLFLLLTPLLHAQNNITANLTAAASNDAACATVANSCATLLKVGPNTGAAVFTLSGTFSGTLQFEAAGADGTFVSVSVTPSNSATAVTSATGAGSWQFNTAGYTGLRIRTSIYASGTAIASINTSVASARSSGGSSSGSGFTAGGDLSGTSTSQTVVGIEGGSIPTSASVIGTNSSGQPVATTTTGTGSAVLATSPTLTTPALGTPSVLVLTNATGLPCGALPAFTGDSTKSASSCATINAGLNGVNLPGLATGLLYNTTGTGAPSIATAAQALSATGATNAAFTPTPTGLTVVGTATIAGHYSMVGNLVFYNITISGATSTASAYGTTKFSLPVIPARQDWGIGQDTSLNSFTGNAIADPTGFVFTPSWSATGDKIIITGTYEVN